jgi:carbamoyltransferase
MEFGPRSLGNRSILSRATDPNINQTLNNKLKRTEFMPFAPITLSENFEEMYIGAKKNKKACEYMTITLDCTKKMKKISPAAIHVDGTARPQIVNKKENPRLHKILKNYFIISNIPNLINTSFNMHEEPIVYSPSDALRGFLQSKIDYLYIGNYLISKDQ